MAQDAGKPTRTIGPRDVALVRGGNVAARTRDHARAAGRVHASFGYRAGRSFGDRVHIRQPGDVAARWLWSGCMKMRGQWRNTRRGDSARHLGNV